MENIVIYHGSNHIIENPIFGFGKEYNDYGVGFYCTESIMIAKEWACSMKGQDGYANAYYLRPEDLSILDLTTHNILVWVALIVKNRKISTDSLASNYIIENFGINYDEYDIIVGYRADDSYFSFVKDFLNGVITVEQLESAMNIGKLGEQIVLKTEKAFNTIQHLPYATEYANSNISFPKRELRNIKALDKYLNIDRKSNEDGMYIKDIIRKKISNEDFKL